jgi:hypothetical protein
VVAAGVAVAGAVAPVLALARCVVVAGVAVRALVQQVADVLVGVAPDAVAPAVAWALYAALRVWVLPVWVLPAADVPVWVAPGVVVGPGSVVPVVFVQAAVLKDAIGLDPAAPDVFLPPSVVRVCWQGYYWGVPLPAHFRVLPVLAVFHDSHC